MVTLSQLRIYPIKSCAGIRVSKVALSAYGLESDRRWMLIDQDGRFLSQRTHPRMALICVAISDEHVTVSAVGMDPLIFFADSSRGAQPFTVGIWRDSVRVYDCGDFPGRWFSEFLNCKCRLVVFDDTYRRDVDAGWTQGTAASTTLTDGFPLLVIGENSLNDLNERLRQKGAPLADIRQFRPNVVLRGLEPYEEDYLDTLTMLTNEKEVIIQLAKPCTRCAITTVNQDLGERYAGWENEPLETLCTYRSNAKVSGAISFGQNAVILRGDSAVIHEGMEVEVSYAFNN